MQKFLEIATDNNTMTSWPGSTDIGAAIMYAFIFIAIMIVERSSNYNKYSPDLLIERKLNGWKHLAEVYEDNISSTRPNKFQILTRQFCLKLIL